MKIHILLRLDHGHFLSRFYPNNLCDPIKNVANQNQLFRANIFNLKHTKYHNIRLSKQTIRQMIGRLAKNRTGGFPVNEERTGRFRPGTRRVDFAKQSHAPRMD